MPAAAVSSARSPSPAPHTAERPRRSISRFAPSIALAAAPGALRVSSPTDVAELEAGATAKRIMRMPAPAVHAQGAASNGVQRKTDSSSPVSSAAAAGIPGNLAGGSTLPAGVRGFMEPRFGADFGQVRVHTGPTAERLAERMSAQAFTVGNDIVFGKDKFQPQTQDGKELIAHELTHTIQQGGVVQRSADVSVTEHSSRHVQRVDGPLDMIAEKANLIPGFRMFTIILGVNPINMSRVERNAANILRALIEFIPGGALITQALANHGVFEKVGGWVEEQIRSLGMTGAAIKEAVTRFIGSLGLRDVFNLGGVWERAKRIFTEPIDRIINFVKGLVGGILTLIKNAILRPLAALAEGTRGYDLLKAILGEDPVTGERVERNAETLIGGFMKLIGQEEVWQNIKRSNAIARAWAWFQSAMTSLMGFVRQIPSLFVSAFRALEIADIILVPRAFQKLAAVFGGFFSKFFEWAGNAVWNLLEIIFAVVAPGAMPYLRKIAAAFRTILKNPIGFIGNLVRAGKLGFQQFADHIGTHLRTSLIQWLTGAMGGSGVYIPQSFDLKEILKFVLSVLGLTWQNIRQKLVKAIGETAVRALETGFQIVVTLVTQGPAAAWEQIKDQLAQLKDTVIEQIKSFVTNAVVQVAVKKLLMFLSPAGAFIEAILAIYNTIMFFVERIKQIAQVAMAFIDSMASIAGGVIAAAANKVEQTMAGLLTLVISFLARFAGLGKVTDEVVKIINKIRAPIDRALDKIVAWIVNAAKRAGRAISSAAARVVSWWTMRKGFTADGEAHEIFFRGERAGAELVVASGTPLAIETFLREKKATATPAQDVVIERIKGKLPPIKQRIATAKTQEGAALETTQRAIEADMNALAADLVLLLTGSNWGTENNPAAMCYPKRRADAYPIFYLASDALRGRPQPQLKTLYESPENQGKVWRFAPTAPPAGTNVPAALNAIGLAASSQVEVGLKFKFDGKEKRGSKVEKFKQTLITYGFRASDRGWDIDHVVELQIGGKDEFYNLWPLPSSENRGSGSIIRKAKTTLAGNQEMEVGKAFEKKKPLWLIVRTTKQGASP